MAVTLLMIAAIFAACVAVGGLADLHARREEREIERRRIRKLVAYMDAIPPVKP
jgi:hypothetical protein